jgi:hypothetical protein
MKDIKTNLKIIQETGYELLGHFILPPADWEADNQPMRERFFFLRMKYDQNPIALQILKETELEISLFEKYHAYYSYVF